MRLLTGAGLALALLLFASSAVAQQCGPRDDLAKQLEQKYGERPIASGVSGRGALVEVFMSADGSSWSIVLTRPNGMACLVDEGEGWRWRGPKKPQGPKT